jgi:exopolysaccharide production protein ExoQ
VPGAREGTRERLYCCHQLIVMATTTYPIHGAHGTSRGLVISWVVLLPILFFCVGGLLIPSAESIEMRKTATTASSLSYRLPAMGMALLCFCLAAWKHGAVLRSALRVKPLVFLTLAAPLSALWSDSPFHSLGEGTLLLALTLFAFFLASSFSEERQIELLVLAAGIVFTLSILLAIGMPSIGTQPESGAWRGLFHQKNDCAGISLFLLLPAMHWKTRSSFERALRWVVILEAILLIMMSQSRTGWGLAIAMISGVATLSLLRRMRSRDSAALAVSLAVVGLVILYAGFQYGPQILTLIGKDPTLSQRTVIWQMVSESVMKRPLLGYGFAAFWNGMASESVNVIMATHWVQSQSQNGLLDVWLQLGGLGIALLAASFVQAGRRALSNLRAPGATQLWIEIVICVLLYNIGESSLMGSHSLSWFLFILALCGLSRANRANMLAQRNV